MQLKSKSSLIKKKIFLIILKIIFCLVTERYNILKEILILSKVKISSMQNMLNK